MPVKKPKKRLWIPVQAVDRSNSSAFVHQNQLKRFRQGAINQAREIHDPSYNRMIRKSPFFFKEMSPIQFHIMQFVAENGLLTEEVVYFRNNGELLVRNRGSSLAVMKRKPLSNKKLKARIASQIINYFGKLHSLGVEHHHPGTNNIVFHNGRIRLIDFKYAGINQKLDWTSREQVFDFFKQDYRCLLRVLKELNVKTISSEKFIHSLVSRYSRMPEKEKQLLEQKIITELLG